MPRDFANLSDDSATALDSSCDEDDLQSIVKEAREILVKTRALWVAAHGEYTPFLERYDQGVAGFEHRLIHSPEEDIANDIVVMWKEYGMDTEYQEIEAMARYISCL